MGGQSVCKSRLDSGTTLTVTAAFSRADERRTDLLPILQGQKNLPGIWLLRWNKGTNAQLAIRIQNHGGTTCDLAADGRSAAEMFHSRATGYCDAILTEVSMPVINGCETALASSSLYRDDSQKRLTSQRCQTGWARINVLPVWECRHERFSLQARRNCSFI